MSAFGAALSVACGVIVLVVILLTEFKDMDFDLRDYDDGHVGMGMAPPDITTDRSNPSYIKDDGGEIQRGNYPRQPPMLESGADLTHF